MALECPVPRVKMAKTGKMVPLARPVLQVCYCGAFPPMHVHVCRAGKFLCIAYTASLKHDAT